MNIDQSKKFTEFFTPVEGTREVDFLILHHVAADSAEHALEQFCDHQVSSHFLIDEGGVIFSLVNENDIAYHAGVSYWQGFEALNKNSIGIEFVNKDPFAKNFTKPQMLAAVELLQYLIKKYSIKPQKILGHSDIAYVKETGLLDRKQDPSQFFDWKFLAENGIGIFPTVDIIEDEKMFLLGDQDEEIENIKENLAKIGYKVSVMNDEFDEEMQCLVRVFHRHFNQAKFADGTQDFWWKSSAEILLKLLP